MPKTARKYSKNQIYIFKIPLNETYSGEGKNADENQNRENAKKARKGKRTEKWMSNSLHIQKQNMQTGYNSDKHWI